MEIILRHNYVDNIWPPNKLLYCHLIGQFHIREIKIENYEVEYIYSRVWVSGAHQFTGFRTVSYFKM